MEDTDGEFELIVESGEKYTFILDFALFAASYAALKVKVDAMTTAINVIHKDLEVTIGDEVFYTTAQATNTGGFNLKPTVKKLNGGEDSAGLFEKWQFRVNVTLPAEARGAGSFAKGLVDIKVNTKVAFSDLYVIDFTGRWKVITGGDEASKKYLAEIKTIITSDYLTPYFAGKKWDVLINTFDFDLANKELNFSLNYKERAVAYTGGGGTKYILGDLKLKRQDNKTIGIPDSIPVPEASTSKDKAELIGNIPPNAAGITPLIMYQASGIIQFTNADVTRAQAYSLWKSEIRAWIQSTLESQYAFSADMIDSEMLDFDAEDHAFSFNLSFVNVTAKESIFALTVRIDTTDNERWNVSDLSSGEDLVGILTKRGVRASATISINIQTLNKPASKDLIKGFLPKELDEKSKEGWLRLDKRKGTSPLVKKVADTNVVFYMETWIYTYAWFDRIVKAKRTGKIVNSAV